MNIPVDQIEVPKDRHRKIFRQAALDTIKGSVLSIGLLQPIVLEPKDGKFILRAGERRLRIVKEIYSEGRSFRHASDEVPFWEIPATLWNELTPLQQLEIEVEENVQREDFTWQERIFAIAALHKLRLAHNPAQSFKATATELRGDEALGSAISEVSDAVLVAQYMDDPDVAKAKTQKEAVKVIARKSEQLHRAKLAVSIESTHSKHTMLKGDALELMAQLPTGTYDVIVTDPPYGVDADSFGDMAGTGHDYEDTGEWFESIFLRFFPDESYRVSKPLAHAYVFCDQRRFQDLKLQMELSGWSVFPTFLIWYKGNNGMLPLPEHGPRRCYETLLYAYKGDRKVLSVRQDVIAVSPVRNLKHGAQKPVALYVDLLLRSARPGDKVLDPFGGTGPILVAANCNKLEATYIEQNETSFNIALSRRETSFIDDGAEQYDGLGVDIKD